MFVSPTPTAPTVQDRAAALGISMARIARLAGVNYRRLYDNRLNAEELARVEDALLGVRTGRWLAPPEILSRDEDGTVRLGGVPLSDL